MKFISVVIPVILVFGVLNLQAQQLPNGFEFNSLDSIEVNGDLTQSSIAEMPIYNPKDTDSKILVYQPEGMFYNMPVIGQKERFPGKDFLLDSSKNLFEKRPSNIDEKYKDDSTEEE